MYRIQCGILIFFIIAIFSKVYGQEQSCPTAAFFKAIKGGDLAKVKSHLDHGCKVCTKGPKGVMPLHWAASRGRKEVAKLLISNGADVNAKAGNGGTPLHGAASFGEKSVAEILISKGAIINIKNDSGSTPLHLAVVPVIDADMKKSMDKDMIETIKGTFSSIEKGKKDVMILLVSKGANINAKNKEGKTPFKLATENDNKEAAEFLRKNGAKE
jgi:ankyrin repeat protein